MLGQRGTLKVLALLACLGVIILWQLRPQAPRPAESPVVRPYVPGTILPPEHQVAITVTAPSGSMVIVPEERRFAVLQGLQWLDAAAALSEHQDAPSRPAVIHIEAGPVVYQIPYDLDTNRLRLDDQWVYGPYEILLLMYGLLMPESEIGRIDQVLELFRLELEADDSPHGSEAPLLAHERAVVDGRDYLAWEEALRDAPAEIRLKYADPSEPEVVGTLAIYPDGVYVLRREIVFADAAFSTPDGVRPGMSAGEALAILGEPHLRLPSHWGYRTGDYIRLRLYLDGERIRWLSLTLPL